MYKLKKIGLFDIAGQLRVNQILYDCGKDMAKKYGLRHWDNSKLKNMAVVLLCELKNTVYLVYDGGKPIATFQIKVIDNFLHFEKLATSPIAGGKGVGTFCMSEIERMAQEQKLNKVCMEVYEPSEHARQFYEHKGYSICGEIKTLKYTELKMEKVL